MTENIHQGHRERMRQKIMDRSQKLNDHELLEVLLYFAQPRKNTNEISHLLIKRFGNLKNIFDTSAQDLMSINGVSDIIASFLTLFPRLFELYADLLNSPKYNVSTLKNLKTYIEPVVTKSLNENLFVIFVDEKYDAMFYIEIDEGDTLEIQSNMDGIIHAIQANNIKHIALAHNHPFGSCRPSQEDINSTIKMKYILNLLGVNILDHLIIGVDGYCSIIDIVNDLYEKITVKFNDTLNELTNPKNKENNGQNDDNATKEVSKLILTVNELIKQYNLKK